MGNVATISVLKINEDHTITQFSTFCFDIKSLVESREALSKNDLVRKIQVECRDYKILIVIRKEGESLAEGNSR